MRISTSAALLVAGLLSRPGSAAGPTMPSAWRAADVVLDGLSNDWTGRLVPLGDTPLVVGVRNDASFVYLCLKTSDEAAKKQILAVGLSVFFDASGKEDRAFGVRFPVGRQAGERPDVPEAADDGFSRALELSVAGGQIEILGREEADVAMLRIGEARPIEAALGEESGALVVELKVPLVFSVDSPHAVGAKPGSSLSLGVETGRPKVRRSRGDGPRNAGSFGGPGGAGGRGLGGRGGPPSKAERGIEQSFGKPVKGWVTVTLATPPAG